MSEVREITKVVVEPLPAEIHIADALAHLSNVEVIAAPDHSGMASALASGTEVLVTSSWDDRFLAPSLKWVQSTSAGVDQFPLERLRQSGVTFTSARGIHASAVSEHAFALLLALTRGLSVAIRSGPAGQWKAAVGEEIGGMTLGIVGYGAIGQEIGRRAQAWGLRVLGVKMHSDDHGTDADQVFGADHLIEVFERSDAVISVLPSTPETRHLLGRSAWAAFHGGYFVNVGRGAVVDEASLIDALNSGLIRGAGLDVFEEEPLPAASPLWHMENVVVTPHVAGLSPQFGPRLAQLFAQNLEAFHGRGPWVNRLA